MHARICKTPNSIQSSWEENSGLWARMAKQAAPHLKKLEQIFALCTMN